MLWIAGADRLDGQGTILSAVLYVPRSRYQVVEDHGGPCRVRCWAAGEGEIRWSRLAQNARCSADWRGSCRLADQCCAEYVQEPRYLGHYDGKWGTTSHTAAVPGCCLAERQHVSSSPNSNTGWPVEEMWGQLRKLQEPHQCIVGHREEWSVHYTTIQSVWSESLLVSLPNPAICPPPLLLFYFPYRPPRLQHQSRVICGGPISCPNFDIFLLCCHYTHCVGGQKEGIFSSVRRGKKQSR